MRKHGIFALLFLLAALCLTLPAAACGLPACGRYEDLWTGAEGSYCGGEVTLAMKPWESTIIEIFG